MDRYNFFDHNLLLHCDKTQITYLLTQSSILSLLLSIDKASIISIATLKIYSSDSINEADVVLKV